MKRVLFYLIIIFSFCLNVKAVDVENVTVRDSILGSNVSKVNVGDEIEVTLSISLSGLITGYDEPVGISTVSYNVEFDRNALAITEVNAKGYDSYITFDKEENMYYVVSQVDFTTAKGNCVANYCQCGDYFATIKFIVKNDTVYESSIKIDAAAIALYDAWEDELYVDAFDLNKAYSFTILPKKTDEVVEVPEIKTPTKAPDVNKKPSVSVKKPSDILSVNSYLKSLSVDGYDIDFDKNQKQYTIYLEDNVEQLKVDAQAEHIKAVVKIEGANDFRSHDNKIFVIVTAEDKKNTSKYTISIKDKKEEQILEEQKKTTKEKTNILKIIKDKFKKIDKKTLIYGIVMLSCIGVLIIVLIVYKIVKNRKMNQLLKKF